MGDANTSQDDEALMSSLRKGLGDSDPVPADVTEFAKAAFTWRQIDADLAELEFDSIDEDTPAGVRSSATARMISFQAGQWMLDIEYDEHAQRLMGVVAPEAAYSIDIHAGGTKFTTDADDAGRFEARGVTTGPLSLVLHFKDGRVIKTQWVVL